MMSKAEVDFLKKVGKLLVSSKNNIMDRAAIFDKYVAPNKNFTESEIIIEAADGLADALEKEISAIKGSSDIGRDEVLANARTYKKNLRGFIIHANKR